MPTIDILALILAIAILLKIIIVLIKPNSWLNFARKVWRQNSLTTLILLILTAITGYYIFDALTIIEVAGTTLFIALLIALTAVPYAKKFLGLKQDVKPINIARENWLPFLIWATFALWVIYVIVTK